MTFWGNGMQIRLLTLWLLVSSFFVWQFSPSDEFIVSDSFGCYGDCEEIKEIFDELHGHFHPPESCLFNNCDIDFALLEAKFYLAEFFRL